MSTRKLQTLSLEIDIFATIKLPKIAKCSKMCSENFTTGKCFQPITVIKTSKLKNRLNCTLYDVATGKPVLNSKDRQHSWLVIDGAKKLKALMQLYESTKDPSYQTIDAIIETLDNIPDGNIIKYMVNINFITMGWTAREYIEHALILHPSNNIFRMANMMINMGVPISNISRYATGKVKRFTSKTIVDYINGDRSVVMCVLCKRALEIYRLFIEAGFSKEFINQRYLIDYINKESMLTSSVGFQGAVNRIYSVDSWTIRTIETLPADNKPTEIERILNQHYMQCEANGTDKTYVLDFSDDRFEENLFEIPLLV